MTSPRLVTKRVIPTDEKKSARDNATCRAVRTSAGLRSARGASSVLPALELLQCDITDKTLREARELAVAEVDKGHTRYSELKRAHEAEEKCSKRGKSRGGDPHAPAGSK